MGQAAMAGTIPTLLQESTSQVANFAQRHQTLIQVVGIGVLAATAGAVVGYALAKGFVLSKGIAVPLTFAHSSTAPVAAKEASAGGIAVLSQLTTWVNTFSNSALPVSVGAIGGGTVGVGVTQGRVRSLKSRLVEQIAQTEIVQKQASNLQQLLENAESQIKVLQASPPATPVVPHSGVPGLVVPDSLEAIHGIGTVFARRLHEAGIYTYVDLVARTSGELQEIIGATRNKRLVNTQAWIDQARQLIS